MFDKIWFSKHQKLLLRFANNFIGRYIIKGLIFLIHRFLNKDYIYYGSYFLEYLNVCQIMQSTLWRKPYFLVYLEFKPNGNKKAAKAVCRSEVSNDTDRSI